MEKGATMKGEWKKVVSKAWEIGYFVSVLLFPFPLYS